MSETNMVDVVALIIFVDVRGFSGWAERVEIFPIIGEFGKSYQNILQDEFSSFTKKNLGDGALLIKELSIEPVYQTTKKMMNNNNKLIEQTIKSIGKVEKKFKELCQNLSQIRGCKIDLHLGWGITKGIIKKYDTEYIGSDINKSARLCGIARPYGIVIDKDDFQTISYALRGIDVKFYHQNRKMQGIGNVDVWVTKNIASQFITRENIKHNPEVHVAGLCFKNENGTIKVLIAKRNDSRKLYPNLFEGCGGQLALGENFGTGVKRHYKLEYGIDIEIFEDAHELYYIQQPIEPLIPGIQFLCRFIEGEPKSENHKEIKWVTYEELINIPEEEFIPKLKDTFLRFFELFMKYT
ncbi:MAG: NUDIX domain-containing protein [Candidatus Cloacimonetes bacterium]|nr:NUDIX domain-containing protein [Candidatus Cloacimonadota bacterium]